MKNNIPKELHKSVGIYQILNIVNGKVYIGSTIYMAKRYNQHQNELKNNRHYNPFLQSSYNKYGPSAFVFSVIVTLPLIEGESRKEISIRLMNAENEAMIAHQSIDRGFGYNIDSFQRSNKNNLACRNLRIYQRGENHSKAILTNEIVLNIVKQFDDGLSVGQISKQMGINRNIINPIVTGANWSELTGIQPRLMGGVPKGENHHSAKISNQTVIQIAKLIQSGGKNKGISEQLNVSYSVVKGIRAGKVYASVSGFKKRIERPYVLDKNQIKGVNDLLKQGVSCREIAKRYCVSHTTISYIKQGIRIGRTFESNSNPA